jgi:hypothetical protein
VVHNMNSPVDYRKLAHHTRGIYFLTPDRTALLHAGVQVCASGVPCAKPCGCAACTSAARPQLSCAFAVPAALARCRVTCCLVLQPSLKLELTARKQPLGRQQPRMPQQVASGSQGRAASKSRWAGT